MSYERLRRQISNNNRIILQQIAHVRKEAVARDTTLYQSVQKQGLYLETILEYDKKFWFIPRGIYFGRKIFTGIYNRKLKEMEDEMVKAGKEAQEKEEERLKKMKEAQENKSRIIKPGVGLSVVGG